ncbi:16S rRNA (cytosine(1402)-N(4))-methyltransferase RsmH [Propionibacterium australiense]|uniref:Ribosomal RNA small subunit methyltransferase H n=1 Tax=Propionibacterium australiense TaxID=119981 RepID=A0A383S3R1_9ACTN|nr:16S rRNA (cytosine(1402)-N(4))-methyltransferase RsmH [Propionibacterium australiense]RLP11182.1 16S rRNA (cytosine(1402)-N(4))-methyltransferase RsmH [Propionibacterium australiense]RLP12511.1 16S rRNA (cytosine(1402)-N(4))-methyltransferase RsmH [Propionibacterium australiense]SYZ32668.1 16S rRNA (cytosine1402-N4)-methyltransferase [Propionibacterium australiense]VEH91582.1 Ribosomal RNA small subunit methyltransferase H [Propionibacterium australiense]
MAEQGAEDGPAVLHIPVLAEAIAEYLAPPLDHPGAVYVDGTLGMAGHASLILERNPQAVLIGIDRDAEALELAGQRLARFGDRVRLVQARFDELGRVLDDPGAARVDAMLLDLGLSSLQIDRTDRGFAYRVDAPLDMRMDSRGAVTAADVLNSYAPADLVRVLREYGEERQAQRIVRAIVEERERAPFTTSARLVRTIIGALPAAVRGKQSGHPARRVFQALRIEVNGELDALTRVLPVMLERMNEHARAAVLAYHSLEDRIVKRAFARAASDSAPAGLPVVPEHLLAQFSLVTHGAQRPTADEIEQNPRAASARLRVIERVRPPIGEVR